MARKVQEMFLFFKNNTYFCKKDFNIRKNYG